MKTTKKQKSHLTKAYEEQSDASVQEKQLMNYLPLVKYIAGRIAIGLPKSVELDDLINAGVVGLIEAYNNFDKSKGVKFESYASMRIRGSILDELRAIDWAPRSTRARSRQVEKAIASLENRLGRSPTEEEIAVKDGKRKTVERQVFPGYILVQMELSEESWYVVRNTPGVTGFVGMGNKPTPLPEQEVSQIIKRMEADAPRITVTFKVDQKVRIVDGPFNDFIGTVQEIDVDRAKVRVMVSFFGRETPVELDFLQVEKA